MKHRRTTSELPIPHSRLVLWFGILTLLLSLSGQIMGSQQVSAENLQPQTLQSDDTTEGGQEVEAVQAEQPVASSFVQIEKFDCPAGSDWSQADYGSLAQNCGPNQTPVNVSVAGEFQSITGFGQWGPYDGFYTFDISEEERPGYGAPHVFCSPFIPDVSGPNLVYAGTSNFISWTVQPGESLYCQMFNYQTAQQFSTIVIHKYSCPDDWKLADPYAAQLPELSALCTTAMPSVQVAIEQNGSLINTVQTGQDGVATWDQIPAGPTILRELLPSGYGFGVVHCTSFLPAEGNSAATSQAMSMQDASSFGWDFQPGYVLDCFWFNFPSDQLQLYKYWCPDNALTGNASATFEDLRAMCAEQPAEQIGWRLEQTSNNQEIATLPASSGVPGYAGYHSFSQGQEVRFIEQMPTDSGFGPPMVYCFEFERGNPTGQPLPVKYDPGTGINWTPKAGNYLSCSFFNVKSTDSGSILIEKYWCPAGLVFAGVTPSQADLQAACQESGSGATFALSGPSNAPQQWEEKAPEGGPPSTVFWDQVPAGDYEIGEIGLDSGWRYTVYCHESSGLENGVAPTMMPISEGNSVLVQVKAGSTVACAWFNEPTTETTENSVTVYKWDCAPGTEFGREQDYYMGALPEQQIGPCESEHLNIPITLFDGSGSYPTTTQANGTQWSGVVLDQNGSFQIAEEIPSGYGDPMVFCSTLDEDSQTLTPSAGGSIAIAPSGEPFTYQCNWYNIPTSDNGSILIEKYWCPTGLAFVQTPTQADYQSACQESGSGAMFSLEGPASAPQPWDSKMAEGGPPASAFWDQVPAGDYVIREMGLGAGWQYIVFCHASDGSSNGIEPPEMPLFDSNGVQVTVQPGFTVACAWFNFGTTDTTDNAVTVYKWDCGPGTEFGREQAYYMGALPDQDIGPCESEHLNIPITLFDGSGSVPTTTQANGTQWSGVVLDAGGGFQIQEEIPSGYGEPMVFCGTLDDSDQSMVPSSNGAIAINPSSEPFTYQCNWYNIPTTDTTDNSVTVYKWECAPGTEYGREQDYYMGALPEQQIGPCESEHLGIPITLLDGSGSFPTTTQANGTQWSGVVLDTGGGFQIVEEIPSGYGDPMVFCGTLDEDVQTVTSSTGGTVAITPSGEPFTYQCNWYNIPTDVTPSEPGTNWITISKYLCAPDAVPADTLGAMQALCTESQSGVSFTLQGPSGFSPISTSTVGGNAEWSDLFAGDYGLVESVPPGYGEPLIWCGYTSVGGVQIEEGLREFASYAPENGAISIELEGENSRLNCYWFNFPSAESSITIYKYNCTDQPSGFSTLGEWQQACPDPGVGYTFSLSDSTTTIATTTTSGEGLATVSNVPEGEYTVSETLLPGFGEPVVWCGFTAFSNGAVIDAFPMHVSTGSGPSVPVTLTYPGTSYFCYWFNIPDTYSSITIYKYDCPDGRLDGTVEDPLEAYKNQCQTASDGIDFTLSNIDGESRASTLGGKVSWSDVPLGDFTVTETVPPGYDPPIWFCEILGSIENGVLLGFDASPTMSGSIDSTGIRYVCWVFDFPNPKRTVEVYKWLCPEGYDGGNSHDAWFSNCTMPMNHVTFSLTDVNGIWTQPTVAGNATWYGVGQGDVTLREHIPPGYFEPVFWCSLEAIDGAAFAEDWTFYPSADGTISRSLNYSEFKWVCNVYNLPKGKGSITINKWLCPPGYDLYGWGADPYKDCAQPWNGIRFTLDQPVGPNLQSDTGDSIPGAVFFGSLDPGTYVVTESVPADIDHVFVLDCYGSDVDKVHPYPLQWGNGLTVQVAGGDEIVCNWYNVPKPTKGWLTVYKYQCWTAVYTSEVDCEIYEFGATFELFSLPGNTSFGSGTTNAGGVYTWSELEAGSYKVKEISHTPCRITTTKKDDQGNIKVDAGQGTIVKIYNCKPKTPGRPGTPTVPGKPPGKYPNTGVDPASVNAVAPVAAAQAGTPTPPVNDAPAEDYYKISCLDEPLEPLPTPSVDTDTAVEAGPTATAEEFEVAIETPVEEASESDATPVEEEDCPRGAIPVRVVADSAQIDAEFETLEIIDGIMEQPTGSELVSWYKETGRLGENNNVVIAAHLNYWGVPEGIFFYLDQMKPGDRVEVTGDDGRIYVFEVEWVRQESNLEPPAADVIGPTDVPSLTMITCGGDWEASISEYDERTVVRALQVDVRVPEPETA